jgi:membrane protein
VGALKERLEGIWRRLQGTRPLRAWTRFGAARGNLLAAGIAYFAFFSLFPALALAAVVFGFVLRGRPDLLTGVGNALNSALPGYVRTPDNPDGILELAAPAAATLSITGVIATVTLVLGGLGWIGSLREGIRAVMGVPGQPGNAVLAKLRDLAVFLLLGVLVLLAAVLSSGVGGAASWMAGRMGLGDAAWPVAVAGVLASFAVDTTVMVLLLRVLAGVPLPWRDLRDSALLGGGLMTLTKLVGGQLIARATASPLFGSIVVVVGLLFWLDLMARIILLTAAWAANDLVDAHPGAGMPPGHESVDPTAPADPADPGHHDRPPLAAGRIDPADPRARAAHGIPDLSAVPARERDRVTLAAGAVLGATAASAGSAVRRTFGRLRGRR